MTTEGERVVIDQRTETARNLYGREDAVRAVEAAIEQRHGSVVISGEAGLGKSSLLDLALKRAHADGITAFLGRCWETVDAPAYWPWIQIIRQIAADEGVAPRAQRLLRLLGDHAVIDHGQGAAPRIDLFDEVASLLRDVGITRPVLIGVEDAHTADEPSLLLLRFVLAERPSLILMATFDDLAAARRPGHQDLLNEVARMATHLRLRPLDEEQVRALYADLTGGEPTDAMAFAVFQASEGNPLFVEEAVSMLSTPDGIHRPDHSQGFRVPEGAKAILRRRLEAIPEDAQRVLATAAVVGRSFDASTLQTVTQMPLDQILDGLDVALRAGVLVETSALGQYAFRHILLRETVYEQLGAAERMRLHRVVAEALEEAYAEDLDRKLSQLAHHWFKAAQAGEPAKTLHYAMRAAQQAMEANAHEEAARLYQRALQVANLAGVNRAEIEQIRSRLRDTSGGRSTASEAPRAPVPTDRSVFKREGDYWTVIFSGKTTRLKDSKGIRHLVTLLKNPGREIHVIELAAGATSAVDAAMDRNADGLSLEMGDAGPALDGAAKAAYKRRLDDLAEDVEEATANNDTERAARAQEEIDAIVTELAAGVGLGGRDRRAVSQSERARISVTKTVRQAMARIAQEDQLLGDHLRSALRTGTYCVYAPDPQVRIRWET